MMFMKISFVCASSSFRDKGVHLHRRGFQDYEMNRVPCRERQISTTWVLTPHLALREWHILSVLAYVSIACILFCMYFSSNYPHVALTQPNQCKKKLLAQFGFSEDLRVPESVYDLKGAPTPKTRSLLRRRQNIACS